MEKTLDRLDNSKRQLCEVWTRVMGYYRPVENYNLGKKSEYRERVCFKEPQLSQKEEIKKAS